MVGIFLMGFVKMAPIFLPWKAVINFKLHKPYINSHLFPSPLEADVFTGNTLTGTFVSEYTCKENKKK